MPKIGAWDGKTPAAKMDVPYEDPLQTPPPFGIVSYFNHPWRGYMDTWPASQWLDFPHASFWTNNLTHLRALAKLMAECGIRGTRVEIGWGSLQWNDDLSENDKKKFREMFAILKEHRIRPLMLLNAHHGMPCPHKDVHVEVTEAGKKGDRTLKLKAGTQVKAGYTGLVNQGDYLAMCPIFTQIDADGTAHLSKPLPQDVKAGRLHCIELKYQPFQGTKLKDGTPVPEAQETVEGWKRYALAIARLARECMGTDEDSGFDMEVWNELTFGSNFLDINRYYDPPRQYAEPYVYRKTRKWSPRLRPDAKLEFEDKGYHALLPVTVDLINDPANGFKNVKVVSGFANQWPWNSGASRWDGQAGLSRHYYTNSAGADFSPERPCTTKKEMATVNALGQLDGKKPPNAKEWHSIEPGSNFIPTFRASLSEWCHFGWKTECLSRDIWPDSRNSNAAGFMGKYGRYTTNGELTKCQFWQTEVNFDRQWMIEKLIKENGLKKDDPKLIPFNDHTNSKHILRQYLIHCHKGMDRIYLFAAVFDEWSIGLFPKHFYTALDAARGELTDEVRSHVPKGWWGVRWLTRLMKESEPLTATRALRVERIIEHKPRLAYAGKGTPEHPHKWNRDLLAIMPFQLSAMKYAIPYYVIFPNAFHVWDETKDPLDPARYDMPPQEFDIVFSNLRGKGARASCHDLLADREVPVSIVAGADDWLAVRVAATDSPRVLVVEEEQPGPIIREPKAIASGNDEVTVSWKTNIPVQKASVSFGRDWPYRNATTWTLEPQGTQFSLKIPVGSLDLVAVRIRVEANGLQCVWPRWDEDVAGQVVMPDAKPRPANQAPEGVPNPLSAAQSAPEDLASPAGIELPVEVAVIRHGFAYRLPKDTTQTGTDDDRTTVLSAGSQKVELRVRYLSGSANQAADLLPITSSIDTVTARAVKLPSGLAAKCVEYKFDPLARPGATNLRQMYLVVTLGPKNEHLLLLSAAGMPEAMQALDKTIQAIFASVKTRE